MNTQPTDSKFLRQILLEEIGEAGQARLCAARFSAPELSGATLCAAQRYAEGCGLHLEGADSAITGRVAPALGVFFRHPSSAEVGSGAAAVLDAVLQVLDLTPPPPS